ncbi:hypothetical protein ACSNOH_26335 [Streptomyces sp. URMC 127]|uniref:hypothetical protein n=1 Tax=Streptomyces sp. URMC 127 TaxID=3423402 RepID=UPI003F1D7030
MKRRIAAVTAAAATAVLVVTGCSSSAGGGKGGDKPGAKKTESAAERQAREYREAAAKDRQAMFDAAVKFRKAVIAYDGKTACDLKTAEGRSGDSLEKCADFYKPSKNDKSGDEALAGTTVTVTGEPVEVPPVGNHPTGTGVMVTSQTTGEGGSADVMRDALRMVKVQGRWLVDQDKEVLDSEMKNSNPVVSALMRSH